MARFFVALAASPPLLLRMTALSDRLLGAEEDTRYNQSV